MSILVNLVLTNGRTETITEVRLTNPSIVPQIGDRVVVDRFSGEVTCRTLYLMPYFTEVEITASEVESK